MFVVATKTHRDDRVPILFEIDNFNRRFRRNNVLFAADEVSEGDILCTVGRGYLHVEIEGTYDNVQPTPPPDPDLVEDPQEIRLVTVAQIHSARELIHFRAETVDNPVSLDHITAWFTVDGVG